MLGTDFLIGIDTVSIQTCDLAFGTWRLHKAFTITNGVCILLAILGLKSTLTEATSNRFYELSVSPDACACVWSLIRGWRRTTFLAARLPHQIIVIASDAVNAISQCTFTVVLIKRANGTWRLFVRGLGAIVARWTLVAIVYILDCWGSWVGVSETHISWCTVEADARTSIFWWIHATTTRDARYRNICILSHSCAESSTWTFYWVRGFLWAICTVLTFIHELALSWTIEPWWTVYWLSCLSRTVISGRAYYRGFRPFRTVCSVGAGYGYYSGIVGAVETFIAVVATAQWGAAHYCSIGADRALNGFQNASCAVMAGWTLEVRRVDDTCDITEGAWWTDRAVQHAYLHSLWSISAQWTRCG